MIETLDLSRAAALLPPREAASHKGSFGHALVIGGARGYLGAAKLAAEGALRSGVGLVTLAVPAPLQEAATIGLSEALTEGLPCDGAAALCADAVARAVTLSMARDAVVLGPGITQRNGAALFVDGYLRTPCSTPLVLDADGLNNAAANAEELFTLANRCIIVTPHPGEAARLLGSTNAAVQGDREGAVRALVALGAEVAVLKGHETLVASADGRVARNTTGGHGLAKGGSGDVVAGLIGGLIAQGMAPFDAACLGVFVHGLAGDLAQARHSARAMLARDVLAALGEAWLQLEAAR